MRQIWLELVCWRRGHVPYTRIHYDYGVMTAKVRPARTRLAFEVCERCGRTLRQWVEALS